MRGLPQVDGTFTTLAYGFGADRSSPFPQFETVVTDANVNAGLNGAVKRTYRDVRELITSVKEFNNAGSQVIWTSYAYDPLKQIVQVVDDKLNQTSVSYDNFGRRTAIENPDAGRTETRYDLASNVTQADVCGRRSRAFFNAAQRGR
jgi:YD repeat-containing protein